MSTEGQRPEPFWGDNGPGVAIACLAVLGLMVVAGTQGWFEGGYRFSWEVAVQWYLIAGMVVGGIGSIALFFGSWYFASQQYGAAGYIVGWVPGGVLAVVGGVLLVFLWGLLLIGFAVASRA